MHFIYSTNKVEAAKSVSLSANGKTLDEVLCTLAKEFNLSFKIEGQHVLIKTVVPALILKKTDLTASIVPHRKSSTYTIPVAKPQPLEATSTQTDISENEYATSTSKNIDLFASNDYSKKQLAQLQPYFDSTFLKRIPARYTQAINKNNIHTGWFMSAGVLVNNYSSGLEVQAGLRGIYGIFSPSWLRKTGELHNAYGLGTSINLKRNLSVNLAYLYASINREEKDYSTNINSGATYVPCSRRINHHQVKLLLQYALTKNLNIKTGLTFNQTQTRTTYVQVIEVYNTHNVDSGPKSGAYGPPPSPHTVMVVKHDQFTNMWLGWEASLSYKINFLRKP
ncbi:MAG TPA: STN domain-containing protein [Cyclobacteriaceae bacterium]|nr:STN domain-containing protein [Cyclobacteriaceae bacterium]